MGLYSKWIFPWVCDLALDQPALADLRRQCLKDVSGSVLEIGIGTGLNLSQYPASVRFIHAIDPNDGISKRLSRRIQSSGMTVDRKLLRGERLKFLDQQFDFVVSTFTMCSIAGVAQAISEVFRVLKPGGRFAFLEHGRSPDESVRRWQRRLNPFQRLFGDGCRLDLDIPQLISARPFSSMQCDSFYLEQLPRTHGYLYTGVAQK